MAIRKVAQIGNPALRQHFVPVDESMISNGMAQGLLSDLAETMREYRGVGLAAPQIRAPLRAFVMEIERSERYPDHEPLALQAILNPSVTVLESELEEDWEGCLSVSGLRGRVPRHYAVRVEGLNADGEPLLLELSGFAARVAQHESDHLDGVVYLDRMTDMSSLTDEQEYQRKRDAEAGRSCEGGADERGDRDPGP